MDKVDEALEWIMDLEKIGPGFMNQERGYAIELSAEVRRLRAERDELRAALKNLVFTASKLWDDAKPIKDSAIVHATHPIIEQARAALSRTEGGNE